MLPKPWQNLNLGTIATVMQVELSERLKSISPRRVEIYFTLQDVIKAKKI